MKTELKNWKFIKKKHLIKKEQMDARQTIGSSARF